MNRFRNLAILLPLLAAGCAHEITIVHNEPHVVSESEARIEAEATAIHKGAVRITACRVIEKRIEQDYWRRKTSQGPGVGRSGTFTVLPAARAASTAGAESSPDSGSGYLALALVAVIAALVAAAAVVAGPVLLVIGLIYGTEALVTEVKPLDEQRTTIFTLETVRVPCESGVLEWASGTGSLDLGKQPAGGWVIDAAMLDRLNLPGATVILRDGDLSATIVIPKR